MKDKQLPELPLYEDENGEPDYFSWCNAYLYALENTQTDWFAASDDEEFEDLFYPIMALGGIYDDDDILVQSEQAGNQRIAKRSPLRRTRYFCLLAGSYQQTANHPPRR